MPSLLVKARSVILLHYWFKFDENYRQQSFSLCSRGSYWSDISDTDTRWLSDGSPSKLGSSQSHACVFVQVRVENLTKERDMLRQAESRLGREKEAMLAEQRNQNLLLTNLKTIQVRITARGGKRDVSIGLRSRL